MRRQLDDIPAECTSDVVPEATRPEEACCEGACAPPLDPHDVTRFAGAAFLGTSKILGAVCSAPPACQMKAVSALQLTSPVLPQTLQGVWEGPSALSWRHMPFEKATVAEQHEYHAKLWPGRLVQPCWACVTSLGQTPLQLLQEH